MVHNATRSGQGHTPHSRQDLSWDLLVIIAGVRNSYLVPQAHQNDSIAGRGTTLSELPRSASTDSESAVSPWSLRCPAVG